MVTELIAGNMEQCFHGNRTDCWYIWGTYMLVYVGYLHADDSFLLDAAERELWVVIVLKVSLHREDLRGRKEGQQLLNSPDGVRIRREQLREMF